MSCCDGFERCLEISVWFDVVELAGLDKRRDAGPGSATFVMPREQGVFAIEGNWANGAFDNSAICPKCMITLAAQRKRLGNSVRNAAKRGRMTKVTRIRGFSSDPPIFERPDDRSRGWESKTLDLAARSDKNYA
jgi:hypothetical protein